MPLKYDKSYYRRGVFLRGGAIPVHGDADDSREVSLDEIAERLAAARQRLEEIRTALKRN